MRPNLSRILIVGTQCPTSAPNSLQLLVSHSVCQTKLCPSARAAARSVGALGRAQAGSTLVATVIISALIGTVLCSYLALIANRNQVAMRALAWNTAMPVLEAGIEEALTHLNRDSNSPTANYWTADQVNGKAVYWKYRALPDGSYFYVTNFNVASPSPIIQSAGYVRSPLSDNQYISRVVQVTATNPPSLFGRAIAANGTVRLAGGSTVDGYNSTNGPYDFSTNRNASGGIATNSKQDNAIDVGSAHVYGKAVTGAGGSVSYAGGSVGDLNQTFGIEDGWTGDDMNVSFQTNSPPAGTPFKPQTTQVGISNITYLTASSSTYIYQTDSFVSNDKTRPMIVTGNCTLWVTGNFAVLGSGYVYIAPGASLNLYVAGMASISGGGVVNGTGSPANFSYFGLSSNTVLNYNGSADFVGTINAPQANFTIGGSVSVYGAIICNTFNSGGGASVHYDQALNGGGKFMVNSWREL